jgi:hypothetical protein
LGVVTCGENDTASVLLESQAVNFPQPGGGTARHDARGPLASAQTKPAVRQEGPCGRGRGGLYSRAKLRRRPDWASAIDAGQQIAQITVVIVVLFPLLMIRLVLVAVMLTRPARSLR